MRPNFIDMDARNGSEFKKIQALIMIKNATEPHKWADGNLFWLFFGCKINYIVFFISIFQLQTAFAEQTQHLDDGKNFNTL